MPWRQVSGVAGAAERGLCCERSRTRVAASRLERRAPRTAGCKRICFASPDWGRYFRIISLLRFVCSWGLELRMKFGGLVGLVRVACVIGCGSRPQGVWPPRWWVTALPLRERGWPALCSVKPVGHRPIHMWTRARSVYGDLFSHPRGKSTGRPPGSRHGAGAVSHRHGAAPRHCGGQAAARSMRQVREHGEKGEGRVM